MRVDQERKMNLSGRLFGRVRLRRSRRRPLRANFYFPKFRDSVSSMASTLLVGDHVVVERESLAPPTKWASFLPYC